MSLARRAALLTLTFAISACNANSSDSEGQPSEFDEPQESAAAVERHPDCPGMVYIAYRDLTYCIDAYESPGFDEVPDSTVYDDAVAACQQRGARLCTEQEWERACRGPEGLRFPYGNTYDPRACNTAAISVTPAGAEIACRSGYGVYDLSGNVAEWVEGAFLKGGDVGSDEFGARCSGRERADSTTAPQQRGFRCCVTVDGEPE